MDDADRPSRLERIEGLEDFLENDYPDISAALAEQATWAGLTRTGVWFNGETVVVWGFRAGTGEFVAAVCPDGTPYDAIKFEPCDEGRWKRLAGRDRPMPRLDG